ncbi:MAG: hypothetical protein VYA30_03590 [Myxococcota bacterium]|nr:hypothetical protein [Myxococcota bacterium]
MLKSLTVRFILLIGLALPTLAHADLFSIYVAGKTGLVDGSGDAFDYFDNSIGNGAEAGVELLGVDIWGEALKMGTEQYYFTANLGFDGTFGKQWRLNLGLYTGPVLFMRPKQESDPFALSGTLSNSLSQAGIDPTRIETEYNEAQTQEDELNRYALGWNLARTKVEFERELVPLVYLGLGAQAAYHYMLTGADAAADAKNTIANDLENSMGGVSMNPELSNQLRSELGAKKLDISELGGFNYSVTAYLKVQI